MAVGLEAQQVHAGRQPAPGAIHGAPLELRLPRTQRTVQQICDTAARGVEQPQRLESAARERARPAAGTFSESTGRIFHPLDCASSSCLLLK